MDWRQRGGVPLGFGGVVAIRPTSSGAKFGRVAKG
jgi:hypothetical protein